MPTPPSINLDFELARTRERAAREAAEASPGDVDAQRALHKARGELLRFEESTPMVVRQMMLRTERGRCLVDDPLPEFKPSRRRTSAQRTVPSTRT